MSSVKKLHGKTRIRSIDIYLPIHYIKWIKNTLDKLEVVDREMLSLVLENISCICGYPVRAPYGYVNRMIILDDRWSSLTHDFSNSQPELAGYLVEKAYLSLQFQSTPFWSKICFARHREESLKLGKNIAAKMELSQF